MELVIDGLAAIHKQGYEGVPLYTGNGGSINTANWVEDAYNEIEFTEQGRGWVQKGVGAMTKFILRSENDINSVAPAGDECVYIWTQNYATVAQRPVLYIEYTEDGEDKTETVTGDVDDGEIWGEGPTYPDARGRLTEGIDIYVDNNYMAIGQYYSAGPLFSVVRSFLYFNTSIIPAGATITKVILKIYNCFDESAYDFNIVVQSGMPTYPHKPLIEADFDLLYDREKTYAEADCEVIVDDDGLNNFFGIIVDGNVTVIRDRVEACLATSKGIRLVVSIGGENVTNAVTGTLTINHTFNKISSFSLTLADSQFSPLVNANIAADVEIIITAFVEREEFKLFTGLVDTHKTKRTKDFKVSISGRGYGRKLLDKRMTLVSVQDSAAKRLKSYGKIFLTGQIVNVKRVSTVGAIIEFLAGQAGITNIDVPVGDEVSIEHSFQDQSIWDMIQKECELMSWFVRFDENGKMLVGPKVIKTSATKYPNPDWEYDEGEFVELGFGGSTKGIINKVIVMGTVFEEEIVTVNENVVEEADWEPEDDIIVDVEKTFAENEKVTDWSHTETVYTADDCKIIVKYTGSETPDGYMFPHFLNYRFEISGLGTIKSTTWTVSGGATITAEGKTYCNIQRARNDELLGWPPTFRDLAFTIGISIKVGPLIGSHASWVNDSLPAETVETTYEYTQIKATCQDNDSIAEYGERQPQEEYTLNKPLAETEEQCKRIGNDKILNSHRFTHQPDILVNFNPLLTIGQTIALDDTKIGYNGDRRFAAQLSHVFPINRKTGAIKPRTKGSFVFYA